MNESGPGGASSDEETSRNVALPRRTVIGAAAWAAPVIVATVASPASAVSIPEVTLSLAAPATAELGILSVDAVSATVLAGGVPAPGMSVIFAVVDPAHGGFGVDGAPIVTAVTDAAGIARPPAMLLTATGDVGITATVEDRTAAALIVVTEPVSTGTVAFLQSTINAAAGSTFGLAGVLTRTAGAVYPDEVTLAYPEGFMGPETASVDQKTGEFVVLGVTAGSLDGSITGTAPGYGTATVAITLVLGYIATDQAQYRASQGSSAPYNAYVISGKVNRITSGAALPATVTITWRPTGNNYANVNGLVDGLTVNVDQVTGAFTLPTLTPVDTGRVIGGVAYGSTLVISAANYQPMSVTLINRPGAEATLKSTTVPGAVIFRPGETKDVSGIAMVSGQTRPVSYPTGFTGPATVVLGAGGAYTIKGVKAPNYIVYGTMNVQGPQAGSTYSTGRFYVL